MNLSMKTRNLKELENCDDGADDTAAIKRIGFSLTIFIS